MGQYWIGTTVPGLVLLESLGLPDPKSEFIPGSTIRRVASGYSKYLGTPLARWHWGFWTPEQRSALKSYCSSASALLYICTLTDNDIFLTYQAIMHWPEEPKDMIKYRIPITILFTNLILPT
jgi:hypothetical protein